MQEGSNTVTVAKVPGIYTVKDGDKNLRLAINIPREESDPATLDGEELASALASKGEQKRNRRRQSLDRADHLHERTHRKRPDDRLVLLIALLALLMGEHLLANNTSRNWGEGSGARGQRFERVQIKESSKREGRVLERVRVRERQCDC